MRAGEANMPELPEVQTIVNDLNQKIKGETVVDFWSDWKKSLSVSIEKFKQAIKNKKILSVERRGKYIILNLDGGKSIVIHLKMTGHQLVKRKTQNAKRKTNEKDYFSEKVNQYIHHKFYFKSGKGLEFSDVRKFGKIILVDSEKLNRVSSINNLGIDAISPSLTLFKLNEILESRKTNIKALLMNQNIIAGIGNIYASEILHEAGILPRRISQNLTLFERKRLLAAIKKILKKAIRMRGTSVSDYRDASGKQGGFQKILKVYGKTGKKCAACGTMIQREVIGQRSTFHCPKCQK